MRGLVAEQVEYSAVEEAEALLFVAAMEQEPAFPRAMLASELPGFAESHNRCRQLLGSAALQSTVESPAAPQPTMTILEAMREAAKGNKQAEAMVDMNVGTAVTEACFKYDHITRVAMHFNERGKLIQFGQTMSDIHFNAFVYRQNRHKNLQNVTRIEALNGHCIEDLAREGKLEDHWFIASSLVPQDVSEKDLHDEGYFLKTLTLVNQFTTQHGDKIITDSGFSRGTSVHEQAAFNRRITKRHDVEAISRVRQRLGLPSIATTEEALQGIVVPKYLLPNGVVDFMRMCDEETDALLDRPRQHAEQYYQNLWAKSLLREQSLAGTRQLVKEALLAQTPHIQTPQEAAQRVWDITKEFTVIAAVDNRHIDARIFGEEAEGYIENTRYRLSIGDVIGAQLELREAVRSAVITGCGGGSAADKGLSKSNRNKSSAKNDDEYEEAVEHNEGWTWKSGICRVEACPTRPGKTQVGPCDVCHRCQKMFDKGIDPTKFSVPNRKTLDNTLKMPNWQEMMSITKLQPVAGEARKDEKDLALAA